MIVYSTHIISEEDIANAISPIEDERTSIENDLFKIEIFSYGDNTPNKACFHLHAKFQKGDKIELRYLKSSSDITVIHDIMQVFVLAIAWKDGYEIGYENFLDERV